MAVTMLPPPARVNRKLDRHDLVFLGLERLVDLPDIPVRVLLNLLEGVIRSSSEILPFF